MDEPHDDFGTEVARLVSIAQDWARTAFPHAAAPPTAGSAAGSGGAPAASECVAWCPICQVAQLLRGEHPELTERLVEAGTALATAMKALADAALTRSPAAGGGTRGDGRPRPTPRVQRIHLDDPDGS
jgi:hypothetical protein